MKCPKVGVDEARIPAHSKGMLLTLLLACHGEKDSITPPVDSPPVDSQPDDSGVEGLDPEVLASLQRAVQRDLARSTFATGASVAVWQDGRIIYAEGFGNADPDGDVPVTPDTIFQIGSDTKKMTALAVLQQVQAGTLSLDTPLNQILPELHLDRSPDWAATTTLHDLLSHQGALFDYTPWDDTPADSELAARTYGIFAQNEYAMAPAGTFWNYANPNFSIAGLALEAATGRPYADVLQEDLFAPLGLDRTFAREQDLPNDGTVAKGSGYYLTGENDPFSLWDASNNYAVGTVDLEHNADNGFTRPAGLVWSTASDMANFAGFVVDGDPTVLDDSLREQVSTMHVLTYPSIDIQGYGYGLFIIDGFTDRTGDFHDVPFWLHGGNTLAFTSLFWILPEQRTAVCILSNGYGDDFSTAATAALSLLAPLPEPVANPGFTTFEPNLADYVGHYEDPGLGAIDIELVDERLRISVPLLTEYGYSVGPYLTPYVNEIFTFPIAGTDYDLTFINEGGVPTYAVNRAFVGTRGTVNTLAPTRLSKARVDALLRELTPTPPKPPRP